MSKFIYLYRGRVPDLTGEQRTERAAAFGAWMDKLGGTLLDVGSPFGTGTSVHDDGTETAAPDVIGYSIIEAADLATAKQLTEGLPILAGRDGTCAVDIYELQSL